MNALIKPQSITRPPDLKTEPMGSVTRYVRARTAQHHACMRFLEGDASARAEATAHVPCKGCTACCRNYNVDLKPCDDGEGLDFVELPNGVRRLRRNPDGSCVHLINNKCSVYAQRPLTCFSFDCRAMSVAGAVPAEKPQMADAILRFVPGPPPGASKAQIRADQELHELIIVAAMMLGLKDVGAEGAAAGALGLAVTPQEEWKEKFDRIVDKYGRKAPKETGAA